MRSARCQRHVDFLIARRFGPVADEQLSFEPLFDDAFVVAAGARNPWVQRRKVRLAELVNESWMLPPPESVIGSLAMQAFRASGVDYPRVTVVTLPGEARTRLLATGRFLTIVSTSTLRFAAKHPQLKALPINLPLPRVPVGIVALKNRTLSPVAKLFIEHARESRSR